MIDCSNDSIFSWTDSWWCKCGSSGCRVGYCSSCGGSGTLVILVLVLAVVVGGGVVVVSSSSRRCGGCIAQ